MNAKKNVTQKVEHTPTPWKVFPDNGNAICKGDCHPPMTVARTNVSEDAAFLVRAVNAYEDYKEVAMYARALLKALEPRFMRTGCSDTEQIAVKCLREAIAKAEKGGN